MKTPGSGRALHFRVRPHCGRHCVMYHTRLARRTGSAARTNLYIEGES